MRLFFRTKAILAIFHKDKYLILGHKFDPPGLWLKFAKPGASHQADCECEEADVKLDGTACLCSIYRGRGPQLAAVQYFNWWFLLVAVASLPNVCLVLSREWGNGLLGLLLGIT